MSRRPRTTALICYNDLTAVGALRGLHALGLRVPDDVSVIGFDDIELAPYVEPPLTTVRQDTTQMGEWAVGTLLGLIAEGAPGAIGDEPAKAPTERITVSTVAALDVELRASSSGPTAPSSA